MGWAWKSSMNSAGQHPPILWLLPMPPAMWLLDYKPSPGYWLPSLPCPSVVWFDPRWGDSLSHICLASGHYLDCPLLGGGVSLSGSLSQGKSFSLTLIFGTRGSMMLDKPWWPHTGCSAPSGKAQACPWPHMRTGLGLCHLPVNTFFQRTWGLTVSSCRCQCFSACVKLCAGQFKRVYKSLYNWLAGESISFPPFNFFNCVLIEECACSTMACACGL
jgi:hypothetical protein